MGASWALRDPGACQSQSPKRPPGMHEHAPGPIVQGAECAVLPRPSPPPPWPFSSAPPLTLVLGPRGIPVYTKAILESPGQLPPILAAIVVVQRLRQGVPSSGKRGKTQRAKQDSIEGGQRQADGEGGGSCKQAQQGNGQEYRSGGETQSYAGKTLTEGLVSMCRTVFGGRVVGRMWGCCLLAQIGKVSWSNVSRILGQAYSSMKFRFEVAWRP